jgi:hypothetical protein
MNKLHLTFRQLQIAMRNDAGYYVCHALGDLLAERGMVEDIDKPIAEAAYRLYSLVGIVGSIANSDGPMFKLPGINAQHHYECRLRLLDHLNRHPQSTFYVEWT